MSLSRRERANRAAKSTNRAEIRSSGDLIGLMEAKAAKGGMPSQREEKGFRMSNVSRRGFIAGSALSAGLVGLAGCSSTSGTATSDPLAAPAADKYPIDPDKEGTEAKWASEELRSGWTKVTNPDGGATLGVTDTAKIIQVDGYAFRDMDGDGKLNLWEDWRQSSEDRAKALADTLTADEILPLMFHDGLTSTEVPLVDDSTAKLGEGLRAGVSRAMADADSYASAVSWINAVQEWCEKNDAHGIPYMNSTDPYQLYDIPDNHCLVSSFDPDLWKKSGRYTGRGWRAGGARVNLGPQVDIGTNIVWTRLGGSICEDPAANRDLTKYFGGGMQSTWGDDDCTDDKGWGADSVAVMLKHYVGAGAVEGGRNDHNDAGKYDVFPGDNFNAHLIPFLDGGLHLESKTEKMASVMPNYGIAYSDDESLGPIWGGAYNARNIGILRNAGWDGMITTDWQILRATDFGDRAHGVKDLSVAERFEKLLEATVDQVGGDWAVDVAKEGYALYEKDHGTDEALARVRDSARRIFTVMNQVQLFDNPYTDPSEAKEIFNDEKALEFGQECSNKSIVMLKNAGNVINKSGITGKPKCYIPQKFTAASMFGGGTASFSLAVDEDVANDLFEVVTDVVGEPTGVASAGFGPTASTETSSDPVYQKSDCARATADQLADCQYAVLLISSPDTGAGEPSGSTFGASSDTTEETTDKYLPISLQYRPYTATTARDPSLAGDIVDGVKENRSYNGKSITASNEDDLDLVLNTRAALPEGAKLIVIVEATNNAQCFHEFESAADVILWSWASSGRSFGKAYGRILKGEVEPSALLPCQMPKDMEAVEASLEDVPRDVECYTDSEGNTYEFGYGLNWSGVIDDERTKQYKAAPLTEPETEVKPGEWSK